MEAPDEPSGEERAAGAGRGGVARLAGAQRARAPARARAARDRAGVLGRALPERDLGLPARAARHREDADAQRARPPGRPAGRGAAVSDRFDELVGEIDDRARAGAAPARPRAAAVRRRAARAVPHAAAPRPCRSRRCSGRAGAAGRSPCSRPRSRLPPSARASSPARGDAGPERVITMGGAGSERDATASIELLPQDKAGNWPMRVLVRGLEPKQGPRRLLRALADRRREADGVVRPLHRRRRPHHRDAHRPLRPQALRRLGRHARRLGRDPAHDLAGCQSSIRFPSGSTAQPKRPNSCSSIRSSTSAPAARSCASIASRSRTR